MSRLFDTPHELAILRRAVKAGQRWLTAADIREAVEWLGEPEGHVNAGTWLRIRAMEEAGLLEGRRATTMSAGREWRLREGVNVKTFTGGIDVKRMDREEALMAGTAVRSGERRVEYKPEAYLAAAGNAKKAQRALLQCPSPWALAERMTKIKWNNPELV